VTVTEKLLVSPEDAAEILSLSVRRIYELLAHGRIRSFKIGKVRRIPMEALRDYIARLEQEQPA
jgi:excisionase family DNA binding protein